MTRECREADACCLNRKLPSLHCSARPGSTPTGVLHPALESMLQPPHNLTMSCPCVQAPPRSATRTCSALRPRSAGRAAMPSSCWSWCAAVRLGYFSVGLLMNMDVPMKGAQLCQVPARHGARLCGSGWFGMQHCHGIRNAASGAAAPRPTLLRQPDCTSCCPTHRLALMLVLGAGWRTDCSSKPASTSPVVMD